MREMRGTFSNATGAYGATILEWENICRSSLFEFHFFEQLYLATEYQNAALGTVFAKQAFWLWQNLRAGKLPAFRAKFVPSDS